MKEYEKLADCKNCQKEFIYKPRANRSNLYCSHECYTTFIRANGVKRPITYLKSTTCPYCKISFIIKRSDLARGRSFCSRTCNFEFKRIPAIDRFWSWVDKKSEHECWEWTGCLRTTGYGQFNPIPHKPMPASRFIMEHLLGKLSSKMFVCHHCDNKKCVNPKHLFIGTHQDNMDDLVKKRTLKKHERISEIS